MRLALDARRAVGAAMLPLLATLGLALAATERAEGYWVCLPHSVTTYQPNGQPGSRCHGQYNSKIDYIQKFSRAPYTSYGVYRASSYGGSGTDHYDSNEYFIQDFHCLAGYPGGHNRHSVVITVDYTLAGSC